MCLLLYCSKCGAGMPDNAKFCSVCGNKLDLQEELTIVLDGKTMTAMDLTLFGNIIQELQGDETPLLCFMGEYNKESILENGGFRAFLLTDKRFIYAIL